MSKKDETPIASTEITALKKTAADQPAQKPIDEWQSLLDTLWLPGEIRKKAASYTESQKFLTCSNEKNLALCQKEKKFVDHHFDQAAQYSFWGTIVSLTIGGLCVSIGLSPLFWGILAGLGAGSKYTFERLAYQAHLKEMEFKRQSAIEECEDKLNEYAYLLADAVKYINAQIHLWNLRHAYLINRLAEPTDQDQKHYQELKNIHQDFEQRIKRLEHLFNLQAWEKSFKQDGLDVEQLHSRLNEHLADLKPIVPKISTDPLMLEAIQELNAVFEEKPATESVEIIIEDEIDELKKK